MTEPTTDPPRDDAAPEPDSAWETWPPKLAAALVAAQAELDNVRADERARVQSEKGSYTYAYASLAAVLAGARHVLAKHGLAIAQLPRVTHERVGVVTYLLHTSGETVAFGMSLRPAQPTPQAIGAALTYCRRYAVTSLLCIATEEDDDERGAPVSPPRRSDRPVEDAPADTPSRLSDGKAMLLLARAQKIGKAFDVHGWHVLNSALRSLELPTLPHGTDATGAPRHLCRVVAPERVDELLERIEHWSPSDDVVAQDDPDRDPFV